MKTKLIAALMTVAILGLGTVQTVAAAEGDLGLGNSQVWSDTVTYKNCYPTSACSSATSYRYGNIIDCRKAQTIHWCVTTSSTGPTTYVVVGVEWLADNPDDPHEDGPYAGVYYYPGFGLLEAATATTTTKANMDPWAFKELFLLNDSHTTMPSTEVNATTSVVSIGMCREAGLVQYRAFTTTKAPYCRPFVYYAVADTTSAWAVTTDGAPPGQGLARISAILRYKPWPPFRQEEVSETKGTWYGYPWVW